MDNREIGTRIRLARRDAGLTQEKLAEKIGVSTVFVSQLESGSRAPGLETLVKLSQTLHVSLDLLVLGGAPAETRKRVLLRWCRGARPASVCWRSAWCEACLQRWTVWMQSRRNADACVFRKRRESAARGAGKTLRGTDLRQGNGLCAARRTYEKQPGEQSCSCRAVFFIQYYFRGKRAAFCHRFCRSVCSSRRATSVRPARWPRPAAPFRVWAGPCPAPSQ